MKRRNFIKTSSMGLAISALPLYGVTGQNKSYKIILIGCGWWGMNILREAMAYGNCKVVGLCDVDTTQLNKSYDEIKKLKGDKPKLYQNYQEAIDKQKPDIAIVATPDHWHALPAIYAMQNGADVYLEKPIAHTIEEGKAILKAARKYNKKVQVGTHRRLSEHNKSAMEFLKSGKVGQITEVKTFVNYNQGPGTINPDSEAPNNLDWDMWLGPAPMRPYNSRIHPHGFRQYLDYTNGQIANWGIHWFDQVLWWTDEIAPKNIFSVGSKLIKDDGTDAPDTQLAIYEFESFSMTWEHKLCAQNINEDHQFGCYFYGTEGTVHLGWRDGWTFYPKSKNQQKIHVEPTLHKPDYQNVPESWADFIQAIEADKLPTCDILTGHRATNISHLAMISYTTGRNVQWDGEKEVIIGDEAASQLLGKKYRKGYELPKEV